MDFKNQNWMPFVLGLLCGGAVVAFSLGSGGDSGESGQTSVVASSQASPNVIGFTSSEADQLPQATHVPRTTPDRVPIATEEKPELVNALEQLHVPIPTEDELEKRYANYSYIELIGATKGLSRVVHEESMAFIDKKMERGLFTTQILKLGVEFERPGSFPDGAPRSTREIWYPRNDGFAEVWMAEIHPKEQPLLEARHKEIAWLRHKVHLLKKAKEAQE